VLLLELATLTAHHGKELKSLVPLLVNVFGSIDKLVECKDSIMVCVTKVPVPSSTGCRGIHAVNKLLMAEDIDNMTKTFVRAFFHDPEHRVLFLHEDITCWPTPDDIMKRISQLDQITGGDNFKMVRMFVLLNSSHLFSLKYIVFTL